MRQVKLRTVKVLKAKRHIPGYIVQNVPVNKIMLTTPWEWMRKRYDHFEESMDKVGMLYPILFTDLDRYWLVEERWPKFENGRPKPGIAVHTGNKRVVYAKSKGYDFIEGIFVVSRAEQAKIVKQTYINPQGLPTNPDRLPPHRRLK